MPSIVSVMEPCYNEQKRIRFLMDAIFAQTNPHSLLDVIDNDAHCVAKAVCARQSYFMQLTLGALVPQQTGQFSLGGGLLLVIFVMNFAWAGGFLWSMLVGARK